jgi:hypothetical protein
MTNRMSKGTPRLGYRPHLLKDGSPADVRLPQSVAFALAQAKLGGPAMRVAFALAIVQYQFPDEATALKEVPYTEFERLTRLERMGVRRALAELEERHMIDISRGVGRHSSSYRLKPVDDWTSGHAALLVAVTPRDNAQSHHVTTSGHVTLPLRTLPSTTSTSFKHTSTSGPSDEEVGADETARAVIEIPPVTVLADNHEQSEDLAQASLTVQRPNPTERVERQSVLGASDAQPPIGPRTLRELAIDQRRKREIAP